MTKLVVSYSLINALSHRNNVGGLIKMAKHVFSDSQVKIEYYSFKLKSWNASTHVVVNIIK